MNFRTGLKPHPCAWPRLKASLWPDPQLVPCLENAAHICFLLLKKISL